MTLCTHAQSGCNYPESECLGLCQWTPWTGGTTHPGGLVTVRTRDGQTLVDRQAGLLNWAHFGNGWDIVAYRRAQP